ncbi:MAG TPA: hypothetical protein PKE66_05100, partial [Pyrinomonadaceae bacterium]|nr:hypothetical protein [Pyrinomonadaceae bacterium]
MPRNDQFQGKRHYRNPKASSQPQKPKKAAFLKYFFDPFFGKKSCSFPPASGKSLLTPAVVSRKLSNERPTAFPDRTFS